MYYTFYLFTKRIYKNITKSFTNYKNFLKTCAYAWLSIKDAYDVKYDT